jgi:DNA polymerase III gamma/tau subunit
LSLLTRYRPSSLNEVIGNDQTIAALRAYAAEEKRAHALLFYGPTGCGKTTLARIVAKELGCAAQDFTEVDAADFRGIETARAIRTQMRYKPLSGGVRCWLLDEAHALTADAQNALLKALEEPPEYAYFMLCTTDPHRLLPTIRGRCVEFPVSTLNDGEMMRLLRGVVREEGGALSRDLYEQIIQDAMGHPRNALAVLEKILPMSEEDRAAAAERFAAESSQVLELCRALVSASEWKKVSAILSGLQDQDAEGVRRQVLGYCKTVLLKSPNLRVAQVMEELMDPVFHNGWPGLVFRCYAAVHGE